MIRRFINRLGLAVDKLLIRTKPMGDMNQAGCGMALAQQVYSKAKERAAATGVPGAKINSGKTLYEWIPADMAPVIIRRDWDPYDLPYSTAAIRNWLWDHVIFNGEGFIIAIHDHGEILTCQDGWQCEAEYFSRVRLAGGEGGSS